MEDAEKRRLLARAADRVCALILHSEVPRAVVDREIAVAARLQRELFPGQEELFRRLYLARFCRLLEQFRHEPGPSVVPALD